MNYDKTLDLARDAFRNKKFDELIKLTDILIQSEIAKHMGSSYFLRGAFFELLVEDGSHLKSAFENYALAAECNPSAEALIAMATILVKMGPENYESALECLRAGSILKDTPEISLGFATIYMKSQQPDYKLARRYYLKAAKSCRVQGLFGYALSSRKLGQYIRAWIVDVYRIVSSPFVYLVIGDKILKGFWVDLPYGKKGPE